MKEKIKRFWGDHKEDIKTYTICVLAPMAVLGYMNSVSLCKMIDFGTRQSNDELK